MAPESKFTPELALEICSLIGEGKTTRQVCLDRDIGLATFNRWLNDNEVFREQYARAKEQAMEAMADEILQIADDSKDDYDELRKFRPENVNRARLKVDTRKWLMSKLAAKKYGDKLDIDAKVQGTFTVNVDLRSKLPITGLISTKPDAGD